MNKCPQLTNRLVLYMLILLIMTLFRSVFSIHHLHLPSAGAADVLGRLLT